MSTANPRHFLDLSAVDAVTLRTILDAAAARKKDRAKGAENRPLAGKFLAMIFEKPSTRTRVSFDVGMRELGGESLVLNSGDMQIGRGETIADTARVLSRYVSAIMLRTSAHDKLLELARHAGVPVINALTDKTHPCQLMADIMTYEEHKGPVKGARIAWLGDGNNVAASWIEAAARFGFSLNLACPDELLPDAGVLAWARREGADVRVMKDPHEAARNADCVVTDTWVSMGDGDAEERRRLLRPYQVTQSVMDVADRKAIFMHDLPAHRGEEVVDQVIDGPQSVIFDEAENRLHVQKAILVWCLNGL